ncbi:MAG: hypothetical protein IPK50_04020 [Fibrobacterota bacterium]|nr:hypothetical protein [Fibrobacterota bacterium]QQS06061.1 MAG: hypothetical protein IPK50_04020 [Fibrobacterota bacterium]
MWITKEPGSLVLVPIGNTLGTAMGANLATESDEQNGSLLASLVGTVLGGVAIGGAMNQAGEAVSSDEGTSSLAVGMGLVGWSLGAPLVATASQRLFTTSSAPSVSLWTPSGRPHEAVGLRMQWRLP